MSSSTQVYPPSRKSHPLTFHVSSCPAKFRRSQEPWPLLLPRQLTHLSRCPVLRLLPVDRPLNLQPRKCFAILLCHFQFFPLLQSLLPRRLYYFLKLLATIEQIVLLYSLLVPLLRLQNMTHLTHLHQYTKKVAMLLLHRRHPRPLVVKLYMSECVRDP